MTTRGIRNNNPGNIKKTATHWQGLSLVQSDPIFFQFTTPMFGIRAIADILKNYQVIHGLKTLAEIINRWAPAVENNTFSYIDDVAKHTGLDPAHEIDLTQYEVSSKIVPAIIWHENGDQPYPQAVIDQALSSVGITS